MLEIQNIYVLLNSSSREGRIKNIKVSILRERNWVFAANSKFYNSFIFATCKPVDISNLDYSI